MRPITATHVNCCHNDLCTLSCGWTNPLTEAADALEQVERYLIQRMLTFDYENQ